MAQQVLHLITEDEGTPTCGTTEGGKFRGFTTNLKGTSNLDDFQDSMFRRDDRRCSKCCAKSGVSVVFTPYNPQRHFKIPFSKKDEAKKAGMWWSPEHKTWFFPASKSHYHIPSWASKYHAFNMEE